MFTVETVVFKFVPRKHFMGIFCRKLVSCTKYQTHDHIFFLHFCRKHDSGTKHYSHASHQRSAGDLQVDYDHSLQKVLPLQPALLQWVLQNVESCEVHPLLNVHCTGFQLALLFPGSCVEPGSEASLQYNLYCSAVAVCSHRQRALSIQAPIWQLPIYQHL